MNQFLLGLHLLPILGFAQHDCASLTHDVDAATGQVTSRTPPIYPSIQYTKIRRQSESNYYISLKAHGQLQEWGQRGVVILLEGGKKISRPNVKLAVTVRSGGYDYSAGFLLRSSDIVLLKAYRIVDFSLSVYRHRLEEVEREHTLTWFRCLLSNQ